MFSVTLLFAFLQLLGLAVSTTDFSFLENDAPRDVKRGENLKCRKANQGAWAGWSPVTTSSSWTTITVSTSKPVTSSTISSTVTTTPSATSTTTTSAAATTSVNPNCPTTFRLYIFGGSFGNSYIYVNATSGYDAYRQDPSRGSIFTIQNGHLVSLTAPGGAAAVPKGTGANGGYLSSRLDTINYDFVDAAFDQDCRFKLSKQVSGGVTLDALYTRSDGFFLGTENNPPQNGFLISNGFLQVERVT